MKKLSLSKETLMSLSEREALRIAAARPLPTEIYGTCDGGPCVWTDNYCYSVNTCPPNTNATNCGTCGCTANCGTANCGTQTCNTNNPVARCAPCAV
jgi:hypothetical protein